MDALTWKFFETNPLGFGQGENNTNLNMFDGTIQALVRESIQNSMDALAEGHAVTKMTFRMRNLPIDQYKDLIDGLKAHLDACLNEDLAKAGKMRFEKMRKYLNSLTDSIPCLDVIDCNTKGMDYQLKNGLPTGRFAGFVKMSGKPNNTEGSGGSFGFGKGAYYCTSATNTMIVSSMTQPDPMTSKVQCVFEGVSMLIDHFYEDKRYQAVGFFGEADGSPIVEQFEYEEGIDGYERIPADFRRTEPGSTTTIFGFDDTLVSEKGILADFRIAVLRNFSCPILNGLLEVELDFGDDDHEYLTKDNLDEFLMNDFEEFGKGETSATFDTINPRPYIKAVQMSNEIQEIRIQPTGDFGEDAIRQVASQEFVHISCDYPTLGVAHFYAYKHNGARGLVMCGRKTGMLVNVHYVQGVRDFYGFLLCNGKGNDQLKNIEDYTHKYWKIENAKKKLEGDKKAIENAENLLKEYKAFVKRCTSLLFPVDTNTSENVDYLDGDWTIPATVDMETPNYVEGMLTDLGEDGEGAPKDTKPKDGTNVQLQTKTIGEVYEVLKGTFTEDAKGQITGGNIGAGHGNKHGHGGAQGNQHLKHNEKGKNKTATGKTIQVIPDVYAYLDPSGKYIYELSLYSPDSVEKARIEISVSGDTDIDDSVEIGWVSDGIKKKRNCIFMPLKEGDNKLQFRFKENNKYSITIKAIREQSKQ